MSYAVAVQLDLPFLRADPFVPPAPRAEPPIDFVRVRRARKYIIRVRPDGSIRVTIPRGGSRREAESCLDKNPTWAEQEPHRRAAQHPPRSPGGGGRRRARGPVERGVGPPHDSKLQCGSR